MKLKNLWLGFKDQLPLSRLVSNIRKGHIRGLFHPRSHTTHGGQPKVSYGSKASAQKAADKMQKKTGAYFSNYKCLFCDGYHLGKNRDNRPRDEHGNLLYDKMATIENLPKV